MTDHDRELWDKCHELAGDLSLELNDHFHIGGRIFRLFGQKKKKKLKFDTHVMEFSGTDENLDLHLRPKNRPEELSKTGFAIMCAGLDWGCVSRNPLTQLQIFAKAPTIFVIFRFNLHTGKSVCMEYLPLMTPRFLFDRAQEFTRVALGQHMEFEIYG